MRRQSGYEGDWINALNGVTDLANTLSRTKATGLQIQNAEDERDRLDRERQGESWAYDYEQMNKGLPGAERVAPENFTRSGDTNIGLPEKTRGLATAVSTQNVVDDANLKKMVMQYKNKFSQMGFDELSKLDTTTLGPDALPARIAQGYMFDEMGKSEQGMAMKNKARSENITNMYGQFKAGLSQYKDLMKSGDKKSAAGVLVNVVNKGNALPHKAMETEDGKIRLYLTTEGKDNHDDKVYTPDELYSYLNGVSKKDYFVQNYLAAEAADALRRQSFEAPSVVSNGSEQLRVVAFPGKNGESYRIEAYGPNGKVEGIDSWQQLYAKGFNPVAKSGQAGDRNLDVKGLQYLQDQANNAFIVEARNAGIPVSVNPETGAIEAMQPLTIDQKNNADILSRRHGINLGWDTGEEGGFMGFGKSKVYSPAASSYGGTRPMARGLQVGPPASEGGGAMSDQIRAKLTNPGNNATATPQANTPAPAKEEPAGLTDAQFRFNQIVSMAKAGMAKPRDVTDGEWDAAVSEARRGQEEFIKWSGRNVKQPTGYNLEPRQNTGYGLRYR